MGRLKLTNKTAWDTRDLRAFILAGLREEVGAFHTYYVDVRNRRVYYGRGTYHGRWIGLYPDPDTPLEGETLIRLAQTLAHETHHNTGERHKDMVLSTTLPVAWAHKLVAEGFTIRKAEVKLKPKRDLVNERHIHAAKMLAKHERDLKRKQNLVEKWRGKVNYYERRAVRKAADVGA
jgi:hypothetical protein